MSYLSRSSNSRSLALALVMVGGLFQITDARASEGLSKFSRPLPDVEVRSLATSRDVSLARALAGRPAVLLLTDASKPNKEEYHADKAKPFVRRGQKATGFRRGKTAELPKDEPLAARLFYYNFNSAKRKEKKS